MDDVICWYDETLVRVMGLREVEGGPCYRVADGVCRLGFIRGAVWHYR